MFASREITRDLRCVRPRFARPDASHDRVDAPVTATRGDAAELREAIGDATVAELIASAARHRAMIAPGYDGAFVIVGALGRR